MTPVKQFFATCTLSAVLIATAAFAQQQQAGAGTAKLTTTLTGAAEVPGPGDPDGRGEATIIVNSVKGQICWEINVRDIETATAAHIHKGEAGTAPPNNVVIALSPPVTNNNSSGCEMVDRGIAEAIRESPKSYYVNVHNAAYPNGALRGQLG